MKTKIRMAVLFLILLAALFNDYVHPASTYNSTELYEATTIYGAKGEKFGWGYSNPNNDLGHKADCDPNSNSMYAYVVAPILFGKNQTTAGLKIWHEALSHRQPITVSARIRYIYGSTGYGIASGSSAIVSVQMGGERDELKIDSPPQIFVPVPGPALDKIWWAIETGMSIDDIFKLYIGQLPPECWSYCDLNLEIPGQYALGSTLALDVSVTTWGAAALATRNAKIVAWVEYVKVTEQVRAQDFPMIEAWEPRISAIAPRDAKVRIRFNQEMDEQDYFFTLESTRTGQEVKGTVTWQKLPDYNWHSMLTFTPSSLLEFETEYKVRFNGTGKSGLPLLPCWKQCVFPSGKTLPVWWTFETEKAPSLSPDFTIEISPDNLRLVKGQQGTVTVTLISVNGFEGDVSLSIYSVPGHPNQLNTKSHISPESLYLTKGGTATATYTVKTNELSADTGTNKDRIQATSGPISHYVDVAITVIGPPGAIAPTSTKISTPTTFETTAPEATSVGLIQWKPGVETVEGKHIGPTSMTQRPGTDQWYLIDTLSMTGEWHMQAVAWYANGSAQKGPITTITVKATLENGGFEEWEWPTGTGPWLPSFQIPKYWTLQTGTVHKSSMAHSGNYAAKLGGATDTEEGWDKRVELYQIITSDYRELFLSFWARGDNSWGQLGARVEVIWLDKDNTQIGIYSVPIEPSSSWKPYQVWLAAPEKGVVSWKINVVKASWGYILIDDIYLSGGPSRSSSILNRPQLGFYQSTFETTTCSGLGIRQPYRENYKRLNPAGIFSPVSTVINLLLARTERTIGRFIQSEIREIMANFPLFSFSGYNLGKQSE